MSEFSSEGFQEPLWKSPRKIEEEKRLERRERFEEIMERVDIGMLTRELAIVALREAESGTAEATDC